MICAWKELISILPETIRRDVDMHRDKLPQEIRLRLGAPVELICGSGSVWLSRAATREDISFCVQTASRYSPWNAATAAKGYLTAPGGHRIGMCGEAVCREDEMQGIREISSLCIRVARDFPGIGGKAAACSGSVLIIGAPGWGKTTLLRDLIRQYADRGDRVSVVDERGELFPGTVFDRGKRTDVLTGCPKAVGISTVLRTMGPTRIAVDEITDQEDCEAMLEAGYCGVSLLATAHASDLADFRGRSVYRKLWESRIFQTVLILRADKSWRMERMER